MKRILTGVFFLLLPLMLVGLHYRLFRVDFRAVGFYAASDSQLLRLSIIVRRVPTLTKFFPFWDKPYGLIVSDLSTGNILNKIIIDEEKNGIPYAARFLDDTRILVNTGVWRRGQYTNDLLVVNFHTGDIKDYEGLGSSGASSEISAISMDGKRLLKGPSVEMVELPTQKKVYASTDSAITAAEFSPVDDKYLCQESALSKYISKNADTELLIGEWGKPGYSVVKVGDKRTYVWDFHWSRSGKYIAAIVDDDKHPGTYLQIWTKDGTSVSKTPVKNMSWFFSWYPSDDAIAVFYDKKPDIERTVPTNPMHRFVSVEKIPVVLIGGLPK